MRDAISIPTAPTNHPICSEGFSGFARRQKAAIRNEPQGWHQGARRSKPRHACPQAVSGNDGPSLISPRFANPTATRTATGESSESQIPTHVSDLLGEEFLARFPCASGAPDTEPCVSGYACNQAAIRAFAICPAYPATYTARAQEFQPPCAAFRLDCHSGFDLR